MEAYIPPQPRMKTPQAQAARARCRTTPGRAAAVDRQAHAEGAIDELKNWHGLDRARGHGRRKLQIQLLLAATAINLKRLLTYGDAGQQAAAGDDPSVADAHHQARVRDCLQIIHWCLDALSEPQPANHSLTGS